MKVLKRTLSIVRNVIFVAIIAFALTIGISFLMGYRGYIIKSGSMEPTIPTGALSIVDTKYNYEDIVENDIVCFVLPNDVKVTHRAISITPEGIETKGDNNDLSDGISTRKDNFIGKNVFSIPELGFILSFFLTTKGKIILITVIAFIILASFLIPEKKKE